MLVSLTVGKVDAGVTVLLTKDKRLIEFPSILLPPDITSGSIVDINVSRNTASESATEAAFSKLQDRIYNAFGAAEPQTPTLWCRNATQTSVVLEWDPIQLATADLLSLALYRNNQKAGNIPKPTAMHSTKISGLAVDTEYTFHLVLRTTAGTFASERVVVRTHKMTDLSGITITTGLMPASTRERLTQTVERIGAKMVDGVRIDTTHFVTTEGRGVQWERANEMNIPVVTPEWVEKCEQTGRILGVTKFYLDAVRGPPGDDGASAAAPPPVTKDLPPAPQTTNGSSSAPGTEVDTGAQSKEEGSDEVKQESEDESSSEADEDSAKSRAAAEQKMRAEERDEQQLPSRPKPQVEDESEEDVKQQLEAEKGGKSPGDRSSFQDVAL